MRDARFHGFGGCRSGGGACRFGVHEDEWMRWVAVEPCHLELRVSLGGSPESPFSSPSFSIWLMGTGVVRTDRANYRPSRPPPTRHSLHRTHSAVYPTLRSGPDWVLPRTCPGPPRTGKGIDPISRANCREPRKPRSSSRTATWGVSLYRGRSSKPLTPRVRLFERWRGSASLVPMTRLALIVKV